MSITQGTRVNTPMGEGVIVEYRAKIDSYIVKLDKAVAGYGKMVKPLAKQIEVLA